MKLSLALVSVAIAAMAGNAFAVDIGVNNHKAGTAATNDQVAAVMKQRNLKTVRLDYWSGMDQAAFHDQVNKIKANGGKAEVDLQISYQWNNSCPQDLVGTENAAYNETVTLVNQIKDVVTDIELLNEAQYRPEILSAVPINSAGTSTAPYAGKPCVNSLTSALRGMSRAIRDVRNSSGVPLRSMLGVVGKDFGFLTYMQQQGVLFDVVGYHIYPREEHASLTSDTWFGAGGPIGQLAAFNRPIHLNEFNCGEIYDGGYENQAGAADTEKCLRSLTKHLKELRDQTVANLESVHIYELLDEAGKPAPENHFGLMFNLSSPKVHLYLVTAFAGGTLTAAERYEITKRGLLTDAEITAMQSGTTAAPAAESVSGSSITTTGTIVDASGSKWTLSGGVVYKDGSLAGFTASVVQVLYYNHTIYQQNSAGGWWAWVNNGWQGTTDPRTTTTPTASAPAPAPAPSTSDTQAPTVSITSPANGATFSRSTLITAAASASDNVGVKEVRFFLNGSLRCASTSAPYQCPITLPSRKNWTGTLETQALDAAGNVGRSSMQIYTR
jgi:hypothetical protein